MAASFNGTTDYLTLGAAIPSLNGKAGGTMCAWFNGPAAASGTPGIVMLSVGIVASLNSRMRLQLSSTAPKPIQFQGRNGTDAGTLTTQNGSGAVAVNTWTHLAVTLDLGGTDTLVTYLNGVQDAVLTNAYSNTTWPATDSGTGAIGAGNSSGSALLQGALADVRIYDRALSAAEIAGIAFARGADANFHGCMHRWGLNELSPSTALSAPKDTAIQARHPTVVGTPTYFAHPIRTRRSYF